MPRHPKCRKVCRLPTSCKFYTSENENIEAINMTVEEYETIRLIDYIGLTQEECAEQMHVARTTVQRIYNDARKKLSTFLVEGTGLHILGGSYELCGNQTCNNCSKQCKSTDCTKNKEGLS